MTDAPLAQPAASPPPHAVATADRRKFIIGGAVGAVAVAGAGYALASNIGKAGTTSDRVVAKPAGAALPVDDPDSAIWDKAPTATITLEGQVMTPPMRAQPFQPTLQVNALHDGTTIAFRITWTDPERSETTVPCDGFRDACAVLLSLPTTDPVVRLMGKENNPVTILHWKADWQVDVDKGFQDLESVFPNAAADYHPPLAPGREPVKVPDDYTAAKATVWLPGMHAGNAISQPIKTTPVEKIIARGFGSATTMTTQDATGRGTWKDGTWRVVLAKRLEATDPDETTMRVGEQYSMAVAIWAGKDGDAGGHKSPSKQLLPLEIQATP